MVVLAATNAAESRALQYMPTFVQSGSAFVKVLAPQNSTNTVLIHFLGLGTNECTIIWYS